MFNNIKISVKLIGCFAVIFVLVMAMMLSEAKVRMDLVRAIDSMYRQYVVDIRGIGELKNSLGKMKEDLYHYIAVPSARNNTMTSIKQETDSIDKIIQAYKNKALNSEEKKLISDFEAAWSEMQRGYKEMMKVAGDGKKDGMDKLLADGSYVIEAQKKTLAAVDNLNDFNSSKKEADINAAVKSRGGW